MYPPSRPEVRMNGSQAKERRDQPTLSRRLLAAAATAALATVALVGVGAAPAYAATTPGVDVSHYQGAINWSSVRNAGIQFAYIKSTEGTGFKDPRFNTNYVAAYNAGVIR